MGSLKWVSMVGNVCMATAVVTCVSFAAFTLATAPPPPHPTPPNSVGSIATVVASLYYAFEGVALALPVENSMRHTEHFPRTLCLSFACLTALFLVVGSVAAAAFPAVSDGSITSYLVQTYPSTPCFHLANALVTVAVLLTYPLQLYPVVEALDACACRGWSKRRGRRERGRKDEGDGGGEDATSTLAGAVQKKSSARANRGSNSRSYNSLDRAGGRAAPAPAGVGTGWDGVLQWDLVPPWWALQRVLLTVGFGLVAGSVGSVALLV